MKNITDEALEALQQLNELHYEITCKDDIARILAEHGKKIDLLMDMVGLLARAENHRIDRAKANK